MTTLVIAEKPSVARDLARVLGATRKRQGYIEGNGHVVTWAVGHLVGLAQPHDIDPAWKAWTRSALPMLPAEFPLVVLEDGRDQYEIVERLLRDPRIESIIAATDAGREGELIFRYIVERAGSTKPWKRLWISSLTDEAIREGFRKLEPGSRYDPLADAARARSRADWLVGMNLSRLYSIGRRDLFSVGRVQTPTLAMVVERDRAIASFVPVPYLEVHGTFATERGSFVATYHPTKDALRRKDGRLDLPKAETARLPADGVIATSIVERAKGAVARLEVVERSTKKTPPPLLYDLTELQRDANRLFGLTAKQTLDAAQALYERHKMLSYPRTDSRHLSTDVAKTVPAIVDRIARRYLDDVDTSVLEKPLGPRFVDDAKVSDHHAIIPTGELSSLPESSSEARVFDLVCRRLLMALHPDKVEGVTTVVATVAGESFRDRYIAKGITIESPGWSRLEKKTRHRDDEPTIPGGLVEGEAANVTNVKAVEKKTQPPKPFTEGTLLTAMETAGKSLDAKELADAMRDSGLGTPATRAATLETLISRGYLVRDGKTLRATEKGSALVDNVHPQVRSAAMTGEWELRLKRMERREDGFAEFMKDIETYVASVVGENPVPGGPSAPMGPPADFESSVRGVADSSGSRSAPGSLARPSAPSPAYETSLRPASPPARPPAPMRAATPLSELPALLEKRFGFQKFRPHQREICEAVTSGKSALVVMPTGAGKSLCYQLPGIARGGTTLVVSPLIALIEDQVAKLRTMGLVAERIHSGMDRLASREVCARYLRGELDFFFLAPERLGVPGFPEMLAKRPPALIAIDEAHCISQWGHDFRPDYRMLRDRLALLAKVPTIALTATATPLVQEDILAQLGIPDADSFIFGFRRTNLAIEVVDAGAADRASLALTLLRDPARRPAIVYTSSRKDAEATTAKLASTIRAETYHAGMPAGSRSDVQRRFLAGELDVIVATVAFGMGIDKADVRTVIHAALPASVEGYYQEIGRAGRDGKPSRAILFHGARDRRTHEFFLERDYPASELLERIVKAVGKTGIARDALAAKFARETESFEKAVEKLWTHGGLSVDADDMITRGHSQWRASYDVQRAHKLEQIERMLAFTGTTTCRMRALIRHFGDTDDSGANCGLCDICAPESVAIATQREATDDEISVLEDVVAELDSKDGQSIGKIFEAIGEGRIDRSAFEAMLSAAARLDVVRVEEKSFERDGRRIVYRAAYLGDDARTWLDDGDRSGLTIIDLEAFSPSEKRGRFSKSKKPTKTTRGRTTTRTRTTSAASSSLEDLSPSDSRVVEALRVLRKLEAKRLGVPPFVVFTDKDLFAIARAAPMTETALLEIRGFGAKKVAKFGSRILRVVRESTS